MKLTARLFPFMVILILILSLTVSAEQTGNGNTSYIYDSKGRVVSSPDVYVLNKSIEVVGKDGVKADNPTDIFISKSEKIYIVDSGKNRILIYTSEMKLINEINIFKLSDGQETTLNKPEGIFVNSEEEIMIADTGNNRVIRCDDSGEIKGIIEKPEGLTGVDETTPFYPIKLASDNAGRIYIISRNINMGIIQLSPNGLFIGYLGAPKVQFSLAEMFWRSISTKEQKAKMQQFVPTEYSNIAIDDEGFLFGTISSIAPGLGDGSASSKETSGESAPIRKLNPMGSDVLKRNGLYPPIGDLLYDMTPSRMVDVAFGHHGIYALLDSTRGKIFIYDDNGNMLIAFGGLGQNKTLMQRPSSLIYHGDKILVLDSILSEVFIWQPTKYGNLVIDAVSAQYDGEFEKAYHAWEEITYENLNFEYAFVGLGNTYLQEGKYKEAMESFKYAGDKENYSIAKELLRNEQMKKVVPIIIIVIIIALVLGVFVSFVFKIYKYLKGGDGND